ncbi:hypothetical protein D3C81_1942310 [compost metagenome]
MKLVKEVGVCHLLLNSQLRRFHTILLVEHATCPVTVSILIVKISGYLICSLSYMAASMSEKETGNMKLRKAMR